MSLGFAEPVRTLRLGWARTRPQVQRQARKSARAVVRATRELSLSGGLVRAGFRAAAGPARAVGLVGRRWSRRTPRTLLVSGFDHLRDAYASAPLRLTALRVGRGLDVSLQLSGSASQISELTALELESRTGERVPLDTLVQRDGESVWLAATLPAEPFRSVVAPWWLRVVGADGPVPVSVPSRRRLRHRWSRRSFRAWGWPARVRLDRWGQLTVTAAPPPAPLPFRVRTEPDAFHLRWRDPATRLTLARFTHRRTGRVVSTPGELDEQGEHHVRLDLDPLLDPADDWDLTVLTTTGGPRPLQSMPGDYPPLRGALRFADAHAATPRSGAVTATLLFTSTNRLAIRVRPTRAEVF